MDLDQILANPTLFLQQLAALETGDEEDRQLATDIRAAVAARPELDALQQRIEATPVLAQRTDALDASLQRLEALGLNNRAAEIRERSQGLLGRALQGLSSFAEGATPSAIGGALQAGSSLLAPGVPEDSLLSRAGQGLADFGRDYVAGVRESIEGTSRLIGQARDAVDPVGQADRALAAQSALPDTVALQQAAAAAYSPPSQATVPPPGAELPSAPAPLFPNADLMLANQRQAELEFTNLAFDQAARAAEMENLTRLGQNLGQVIVPEVRQDFLSPAAAMAQAPAIGVAPANVQDTLRQTQAVTENVAVPDLTPAARANIQQRTRAARITQQQEDELIRQQQASLALARQQFIDNVLTPIMRAPR